jgi:hypothetical protein
MRKLLSIGLFFLGSYLISSAQTVINDHYSRQKEKLQMLRAYERKDIGAYKKYLDKTLAVYRQGKTHSSKEFDFDLLFIKESYYLLADLYALAGDKENALAYPKKSENYDYKYLTKDHDLDGLRNYPRFIRFLDSAKKKYDRGQSQREDGRKKDILNPQDDLMPDTAYEEVMKQFQRFYNNGQTDSIANLFSRHPEQADEPFYTKNEMQEMTRDYGKIISFKYMARDDRDPSVVLFKIICEKSTHVMGFSIDKYAKFETYRFETSSLYIDKLLAREL